jgi:hypothetical protein
VERIVTRIDEQFRPGDKVRWADDGGVPLYGVVERSGHTFCATPFVAVRWGTPEVPSQSYGAEDLRNLINLTRPVQEG